MKLSKLLELIDFGYTVPMYSSNQLNEASSLEIRKDGVYYWDELTIDKFENIDLPSVKLKKTFLITKDLNVTKSDPEYKYYYALFSLFYDAGKFIQLRESSFDIIDYATYYTLVHIGFIRDELRNDLDFSQINEMSTLINTIQNDEKLYQEFFDVNVYDGNLSNVINETKSHYQFGNIASATTVHIDLYKNSVVLKQKALGKAFEYMFDTSGTIEKRILKTLSSWHKERNG